MSRSLTSSAGESMTTAVDGDAALPDPLLGLAARAQAGARHQLGDALAGFFRRRRRGLATIAAVARRKRLALAIGAAAAERGALLEHWPRRIACRVALRLIAWLRWRNHNVAAWMIAPGVAAARHPVVAPAVRRADDHSLHARHDRARSADVRRSAQCRVGACRTGDHRAVYRRRDDRCAACPGMDVRCAAGRRQCVRHAACRTVADRICAARDRRPPIARGGPLLADRISGDPVLDDPVSDDPRLWTIELRTVEFGTIATWRAITRRRGSLLPRFFLESARLPTSLAAGAAAAFLARPSFAAVERAARAIAIFAEAAARLRSVWTLVAEPALAGLCLRQNACRPRARHGPRRAARHRAPCGTRDHRPCGAAAARRRRACRLPRNACRAAARRGLARRLAGGLRASCHRHVACKISI